MGITVNLRMNEDGTVWCVAKQDSGSGTTAPTSAEIRGNYNVDSWGTSPVKPESSYYAAVRLENLDEDTVYDIYCFAIDMSNNGIDGTPSRHADPLAIPNTKSAGLRTLATLIPTEFSVQTSTGEFRYNVVQATWNSGLPRVSVSGNQERCDLESWNTPLKLQGALLYTLTPDVSYGCAKLPAVPRGGGPFVALLRRGRCTFRQKAERAYRAGYGAMVIIDFQANPSMGILPDMTANDDSLIEIPAWIISRDDGEAIAAAYTTHGSVRFNVVDLHRLPRRTNFQRDRFGMHRYAVQ